VGYGRKPIGRTFIRRQPRPAQPGAVSPTTFPGSSFSSADDLNGAWLTHLHPDHWTDIPLAIHALALGAAEHTTLLLIYGPPGWAGAVGASVQCRLDDREPVFEPRELSDGMVVDLGEATVEAVAVEHSVDTYALRICTANTTLAYSADSASCPALLRVAREADLLLCGAGTIADSSPLHLNPRQAGEVAAAAGARQLGLTHLRPSAAPEQAIRLARETYPRNVEVATEGAEFEIGAAPA
jgi:ribonuclease BN (tRNA processing enzyme)